MYASTKRARIIPITIPFFQIAKSGPRRRTLNKPINEKCLLLLYDFYQTVRNKRLPFSTTRFLNLPLSYNHTTPPYHAFNKIRYLTLQMYVLSNDISQQSNNQQFVFSIDLFVSSCQHFIHCPFHRSLCKRQQLELQNKFNHKINTRRNNVSYKCTRQNRFLYII